MMASHCSGGRWVGTRVLQELSGEAARRAHSPSLQGDFHSRPHVEAFRCGFGLWAAYPSVASGVLK